MTTELKGTKNTKEVLALVLAGLRVGVAAMKDGKLSFDDLIELKELIPVVGPAISDIGEVPSEIGDLSTEEAADCVAYVMAELAIDDAKAKAVVTAGLKVAVAGYELYKAVTMTSGAVDLAAAPAGDETVPSAEALPTEEAKA